ncbi:ScbR family autoregulator-binding transcription factor [Streptomyces sp. NPDC002812]|uniref:ScbR family autoregulator-binding transcription factor n=1 Tax=unclassified Streptomyces TaxID=2593676 RepID=UPI00202E6B3B|nr:MULTISPECIES: ScbR family autoregulator-binding transcription factor [unclassified Streptomyces]MCM1970562.1 TetR/AcrR family transcriptional regulator [Streptomyces sp. G1]MCX5130370.1 ScbR family autoregulator-binding transcription factor [Streptomyces sp. NBC_00347]MCX5301751.1 ScbR family autoregulator-binding transcription factor [Streptomyces sp. NBC_00193]
MRSSDIPDGPAGLRADKQPKQERSRRTKAQILEVAAGIFAEQGYSTVTLQDVADRASMTKGAVYFHFTNKEALATAVVQEHYLRWQPILEEVRERGLRPLESVLAVMDRVAEVFQTDTVVQAGARLQLERSLIGAELPRPYLGWQGMLTEMLTEAAEAGQLRPGTDPAALARVLVSSFFGLQHISDVLTGRADLMERYTEMRDIVFLGVTA